MPKKELKVLMAGAECSPFIKIGGLADVMGTLPQELNALGCDARVILPFHRAIKTKYNSDTKHITHFYIPIGDRAYYVGIEELIKDNVIYYFVDNEEMFGGPVYKGGQAEGEQYAFFCLAVCESLDRIDFVPDIVHANDWQTGMIPTLLKNQLSYRPQANSKVIYTIHNMQYQGNFGFETIKYWLRLRDEQYLDNYSFTKSALLAADWLSTVSPTYAKEICTPEYGCGLDPEINYRKNQISGIVNGINVAEFSPERDELIPYHFSVNNLSGKAANRNALIEKSGLVLADENTLVVGMVSRLVEQKGLDIIAEVADRMLKENAVFVFLGTGEAEYEELLRRLEYQYPGRVKAYIQYANDIAHLIYAGSDLFLMPSRFEPCGISQMIAQAYGTIPIVRKTGGLNDTIHPFDETSGQGDGVAFEKYSGKAMIRAIRAGIKIICNKDNRDKIIKNAMNLDNSFTEAAKRYIDMYKGVAS